MPSVHHLFLTTLVYFQFWTRITANDCLYLRESFYPSLLGPSNWHNKHGWSDTTNLDCCTWFGVVCKHDRVEQLVFIDNNLGGTLPKDIGQLKSLEVLSLINTRTTGSIPTSIGFLSRLRVFSIFRSQFAGSIPKELFQLPLEYVNLNDNKLDGSVPSTITELKSASYIGMRGNSFTGAIPSIQLVKQGARCDLGGTNEWLCKSSNISSTCTGIENLRSCELGTTSPNQPSATVTAPVTSTPQDSEDKRNIIIGVSILGGVVALALATLLITWRRKIRRNKRAIANGKERMLEDASPKQPEEAQEVSLHVDVDSAIGIPSTSKVASPASPVQRTSRQEQRMPDLVIEEPPAKQKGFSRPFKPILLMEKLKSKKKAKKESVVEIQAQPSTKPQRRSIINPSFWNEQKSTSSTRSLKNKPPPIKIVPFEEVKGVNSAPSSPRTARTQTSRSSFSAPPSPTLQKKPLRDTPVSPMFARYLAEASKPVPPLTSLHTTTGQVQYPKDKNLKKLFKSK